MRSRQWAGGLMLALAVGCAQSGLPRQTADLPESPKTLLVWNAPPDEDKKEPEGEGDPAEAKPEEPDVIATDRPDFTEASSTVGKNRVQLEAGYTYFRDSGSGVTAHSYPEALLRIGLFEDWFELRLGQNVSNTRLSDFAGTSRITGFEDLYVGTKLALTEQKTWGPEMALIIQATVPTGKQEYTSNRTLPGLSLLYGWDVNDFISVAGSTQGNAAVDGNGGNYLELAQSITIGYTLTEKWGAYTEVFWFIPHGAGSPDAVPMYYANAGFTYKLTNNLQYDVRVGTGLNAAADDLFAGAGFACRY